MSFGGVEDLGNVGEDVETDESVLKAFPFAQAQALAPAQRAGGSTDRQTEGLTLEKEDIVNRSGGRSDLD